MTDTLPNPQPISAAAPPVSMPDIKPLVMIVGPDEDTRFMFRVILELWNYDVVEAESTDQSIMIGRDRHPSLVLLDTTIHFEDGLDEIDKIKHGDGLDGVPSVVMSGYSQDIYRQAAFNSGASAFLVKPVDFDTLHVYIETLLGKNKPHKMARRLR